MILNGVNTFYNYKPEDSIVKGERILVLDDLLATGVSSARW